MGSRYLLRSRRVKDADDNDDSPEVSLTVATATRTPREERYLKRARTVASLPEPEAEPTKKKKNELTPVRLEVLRSFLATAKNGPNLYGPVGGDQFLFAAIRALKLRNWATGDVTRSNVLRWMESDALKKAYAACKKAFAEYEKKTQGAARAPASTQQPGPSSSPQVAEVIMGEAVAVEMLENQENSERERSQTPPLNNCTQVATRERMAGRRSNRSLSNESAVNFPGPSMRREETARIASNIEEVDQLSGTSQNEGQTRVTYVVEPGCVTIRIPPTRHGMTLRVKTVDYEVSCDHSEQVPVRVSPRSRPALEQPRSDSLEQ